MYSKDEKNLAHENVIDFTFPKLHLGKQSYVDFYIYNPALGRKTRKKYMINSITKKSDRRKYGEMLINRLFNMLIAGWNPYIKSISKRQNTPIKDVFSRYIDYVFAAEKKGVIKPKTAREYRSKLNHVKEYLTIEGNGIYYIYQIDKEFVIDFLDHLMYDLELEGRTRNNYRTWFSTFFTWLKDRHYVDSNPIEAIPTVREKEKFRTSIAPESIEKLSLYLSKNNPPFYLACLMEYYTFIRPDELRYIRIGDISIKDQTIFVSSEISKNRKGQYVALNDKVLKVMIEQRVFDHPSGEYLIGSELCPGLQQLSVNRLRQEWNKVRKILHFPDSYQFYSLKDTGIRDLANSKGIVFARDQARHSDISVTNKYLVGSGAVSEETKHFNGKL